MGIFRDDPLGSALDAFVEEALDLVTVIRERFPGEAQHPRFLPHKPAQRFLPLIVGCAQEAPPIHVKDIEKENGDRDLLLIGGDVMLPAPLHERLEGKQPAFWAERDDLPFDDELTFQLSGCRSKLRELSGDGVHAAGEQRHTAALLVDLHPLAVVLLLCGNAGGHALHDFPDGRCALREHHLDRPAYAHADAADAAHSVGCERRCEDANIRADVIGVLELRLAFLAAGERDGKAVEHCHVSDAKAERSKDDPCEIFRFNGGGAPHQCRELADLALLASLAMRGCDRVQALENLLDRELSALAPEMRCGDHARIAELSECLLGGFLRYGGSGSDAPEHHLFRHAKNNAFVGGRDAAQGEVARFPDLLRRHAPEECGEELPQPVAGAGLPELLKDLHEALEEHGSRRGASLINIIKNKKERSRSKHACALRAR